MNGSPCRVRLIIALLALVLPRLLPMLSVRPAPTPATLRGGIVINEVLIDPNSPTLNFDTDRNGTANTEVSASRRTAALGQQLPLA